VCQINHVVIVHLDTFHCNAYVYNMNVVICNV